MASLLPSIVVPGLATIAALILARGCQSPPDKKAERFAASRALTIALVIQAIHFSEELATGFHERLGPVFDLPGMPLNFFVVFNVAWLVIWIASVTGLRSARPAAFFAAWFLAIAPYSGVGPP